MLPRSACPGKCSGEGECVSAGAAAAAEEPRCVCHLGFTGADCSQPVPQCYSGCSGKGTCIRGVCSCHPGWFGLDCSVDLSRRAWLPGGGMTVMTDPPFGRFESAPAPLPERSPDPESQRLDPRRRNRLKARLGSGSLRSVCGCDCERRQFNFASCRCLSFQPTHPRVCASLPTPCPGQNLDRRDPTLARRRAGARHRASGAHNTQLDHFRWPVIQAAHVTVTMNPVRSRVFLVSISCRLFYPPPGWRVR